MVENTGTTTENLKQKSNPQTVSATANNAAKQQRTTFMLFQFMNLTCSDLVHKIVDANAKIFLLVRRFKTFRRHDDFGIVVVNVVCVVHKLIPNIVVVWTALLQSLISVGNHAVVDLQ